MSSPLDGEHVLEVRNLTIRFRLDDRDLRAVRDVSFDLRRGEVLALVGASGSGKSTIGLALTRLLGAESNPEIRGEVRLWGEQEGSLELLSCPEREIRRVRGGRISMIFQEPMSSLNPMFTIGRQIVEAIRTHRKLTVRQAQVRATEMLGLLAIPDPRGSMGRYPHQLSGGMRQRVMIAMALACDPEILVADEPTTALDVTIQAQIVEHLTQLREQLGMSIIFITHDLGLVRELADRVLVLYAGQVVETGDVDALFRAPLMPYTQALLRSMPRLGCSEVPGFRMEPVQGNVPSPENLPPGCAFHPRCPFFEPTRCDSVQIPLEAAAARRMVRCRRWRELHEGGLAP